MATVLPFKALRPTNDKVHLVASRSVDGYSVTDLKEKLSGNPYTFLHVINPDFDDGQRTRPGSKERLLKVKKKFKSFIQEKIFKRDEKPAYYIYRQIKSGDEYIGIIACTSIDDYMNGVIKIHEQTITQREEKLKDYLEVCEFNAEPVLFCYPNNPTLDNLISDISQSFPDYDFTTTDKVRHTLWVVNEDKEVQLISRSFSSIPSIYIADGHHRSASSALLGNLKRKAKKNYTGKEAFNYYLGIFFAETQLKIFDYNRLVKDLNNLSTSELLERLKAKFEVKEVDLEIFKPQVKHELSMYLDNKWYSLVSKEGTYNSKDPIGSLDAYILTEHILSPLFGIHDLKTDKRIGFVPGVKGPEALKKHVDEGKAEVAFGLYPVTMEHLKWIADTNNIMPPKSTWVEPKMRSGLVIYSFEEESPDLKMVTVKENLTRLKAELSLKVALVAVSKTKPVALMMEAYNAGQRDFGENYVQELVDKQLQMPKDICWHFIGHLQSNKVKYIAPFVHLIHGVDSLKLLKEINKQGEKNKRVIECLLQVYIAKEETKFGFDKNEISDLLESKLLDELKFVSIKGLMGMASNVDSEQVVGEEFNDLATFFRWLKAKGTDNFQMRYLSCGMSNDYHLALKAGSNMIRIGSTIFGERNYG